MRKLVPVLLLLQAICALRVFGRFIETRGGRQIERKETECPGCGKVTVLVPVLNEARRLAPCLEGLTSQGPEVTEILVIDGGSIDGTQEIVEYYVVRDRRVRLIDASPVPAGVNGKAYGLQVGYEQSADITKWIVTIDADVRMEPLLIRSLLAHADEEGISVVSAATLQRVSGAAEGLLHPSMLTTLVYRFGIPGQVATSVERVQANGQCFLVSRRVLDAVGGFANVLDSVCEDVTLARMIVTNGHPVGFFETDGLVSAEMYGGWRDAWRNWPRSLPMRDRFSGLSMVRELTEVLLVQALPLWLTVIFRRRLGTRHPATALNVGLVCARLGVLAGTARAYERRPWTYWLSPLCDLPVALRIWSMAWRRSHVWRGRAFSSGGLD